MMYECHKCCDADGHPCGWALWKMEESEELLRSICAADCQPCAYSNATRRCEYYSVRAMLRAVLGEDKMIAYYPSGRPFLTDHSYHISITHTKGFCGLAWHAAHPIGMDVEQISDRVSRVAHRFVSIAEQSGIEVHFAEDVTRGQLFLWSAKEAAYKLVDRPATDFLQDIVVDFSTLDAMSNTCMVRCRVDTSDDVSSEAFFPLRYRFFPSFVLTLVGMDYQKD